MTAIVQDLRVLLRRDLAAFQREVRLFPDDAALWRAALYTQPTMP